MNLPGAGLLPHQGPGDDAPWMPGIVEFALSSDPHVHFGGFGELADMATTRDAIGTLTVCCRMTSSP